MSYCILMAAWIIWRCKSVNVFALATVLRDKRQTVPDMTWKALYSAKLSQPIILTSDQFKDLAYWSAYWFVQPSAVFGAWIERTRQHRETPRDLADARHKGLPDWTRISYSAQLPNVAARRQRTMNPFGVASLSRAHADLGLFRIRKARNPLPR